MDLKVLWMDGTAETYKNVTASVRDGVLHIHEYDKRHALVAEWHFPISNIRVWAPADQANGHAYAQQGGSIELSRRRTVLSAAPGPRTRTVTP